MISLNNKRIFVSGGAGVIGRELVNRLVDKGAVLLVGDLTPIPDDFPKEIIFRQGDLNYLTQEEIDRFNPEIFFHLAATFERSVETYEHWEENFWHNLKLSNLLMTLIRNVPSVKRVVFASSYLIYDKELYNYSEPQEKPKKLKENNEIVPRNLTGMAKLAHEIELAFLSNFKSDQFTSISARIFRGYGKGSRDVISRWIRYALDGKTISVFNPEGMFDYIYAGDTAEGLIRLSQIEDQGVVNLGTGRSRKVENIVSILKQYFSELTIKYSDSDLLYESSQADIGKLDSLIGWSPKYDLEETIPRMIEYENDRSNSFINYSNVLITSISKKVPLIQSVKKGINKINPSIKVFGADADNSCIGKYFVDEFWHMPSITDLSVDILVDYCKEMDIGLIIPTRDGELEYFSTIKNQLNKNGISVLISNSQSIVSCLDKLKFSQLKGIHAIPASININDIKAERFVVKERFGAGAENIGINLDRENALIHGSQLENPIYQPFIHGGEISVDAYVTLDGNVKGIIMRRRDIIIDGESQVTSTFNNNKLEKVFKNIIASLNLYGHVILQAIISKQGNVFLIECNSRFGGASTLSLRAGLDSFYWAYLESMGSSIKNYTFINSHKTIKQVRHPHDYYL